MIPARYAATRFPAKLMQQLGNKTVIRHTYDNTKATGLFDDVIVVTDSDIIFEEISSHGGKAMKSIGVHESGSDRIAEAALDLKVDIIVNVQGDEPFVRKEPLQKLLDVFGTDVPIVNSQFLSLIVIIGRKNLWRMYLGITRRYKCFMIWVGRHLLSGNVKFMKISKMSMKTSESDKRT